MSQFPEYSPTIERNLLSCSKEALGNGISLLEEANILYEHDRFARATSLAILAEEELSKALILMFCIQQKRWDKEIYKVLKSHGHKQAMSEALSKLTMEMMAHYRKASRTMIAYNSSFSLERRVNEHKEEVTKKLIEKKKLDRFKQGAQFVGVGKDGATTRRPALISKDDAAKAIDRTIRFKVITETQFGKIGDDHPLLRTESTMVSQAGEVTLKHVSGLDISMSLLDATDFPAPNPNRLIGTFNSIEPDELTPEQRIIFSTLLKKYRGIEQMEDQMEALGLKQCKFLDDCRQLVREVQD